MRMVIILLYVNTVQASRVVRIVQAEYGMDGICINGAVDGFKVSTYPVNAMRFGKI